MEVQEVTEEDLIETMPPADVIQDWFQGKQREYPEPSGYDDIGLRFDIGVRVQCCVGQQPDGQPVWAAGSVSAHWYTQPNFPPGMRAPYQIKLDDGRLIFAP